MFQKKIPPLPGDSSQKTPIPGDLSQKNPQNFIWDGSARTNSRNHLPSPPANPRFFCGNRPKSQIFPWELPQIRVFYGITGFAPFFEIQIPPSDISCPKIPFGMDPPEPTLGISPSPAKIPDFLVGIAPKSRFFNGISGSPFFWDPNSSK